MSEKNDRIDVDAVPMGSEAAEILKGGGALVKLENHTQMMIALQHPRDEAKILEAAVNEMVIYEEAAEEAVYQKPVGRDKDGVMQFAEGLSVRAAEALALRWGNNAFGAEITADDGETVSGVATWLDYESNNRRTFPFRVSRKYKARGGTMKRHAEDRFNDIVVPAKLSRVLREVILRSLPAGLKKAYERKAREITAKKGQNQAAGIIKGFAYYGVGQKDVEALVQKPMQAWGDDEIVKLVRIGTALKQGETTVEQLFSAGEETAKPTPSSPKDIFNGAPKGFGEEKKGESKPEAVADPSPSTTAAGQGDLFGQKPDDEVRRELYSMLLVMSKSDSQPEGNPEVADRLLVHYAKVDKLDQLVGDNLVKAAQEVKSALDARKITG